MAGQAQSVLDGVREIVGRYNRSDRPLEAGTHFTDDLGIDSTAAMDIIMEVEDRFEIDIPLNRVSEILTIGDLAAVVAERVSTK
ncbi:MAG: acyl carrier protein [Geminicoccaceae bacterium]